MGRKNTTELIDLIEQHKYAVFNQNEFFNIWKDSKYIYGFKSMNLENFASYLIESGLLTSESMVDNENGGFIEYGITERKPDILDFAAARSRVSYFSYYTALSIHNLTLQIPKNIYLTYERSTPQYNNHLTQEGIDNAFNKAPRQTNNYRSIRNNRVYFINGRFNKRLGVIPFRDNLLVTDIERTLIDIVTRPFYSGGITQVIEAFANAKGNVSIQKLFQYYNKMRFTYPYHEAIGFYLEKAGYQEKDIIPFYKMEQNFKFYLTYNMPFKEFSPHWNLYYPKGI